MLRISRGLRHRRRERIHFTLRLLDGCAWAQPGHAAERSLEVFLHRPEWIERAPDLELGLTEHEIRSHDSGNGVALPVEKDLAANESRVAMEVTLPETIADDHGWRRVLVEVVGPEQTPV